MLSNTSVIRNVIEREIQRFDTMYARRAFVHWYIGEGLEKNEMPCAPQEVECLVYDYKEVREDLLDPDDDEDL